MFAFDILNGFLDKFANEYLALDSYEFQMVLHKNKANVYLYARTHHLGLHVLFMFMCPYGACTASAVSTVPVNTSFCYRTNSALYQRCAETTTLLHLQLQLLIVDQRFDTNKI